MNKSKLYPVIIVGAPRSGTNLLRDLICKIDNVGTWSCDEINPIWKYGNENIITDDLKKNDAKNYIKKYIRKSFYNISRSTNSDYVVEKTCANSLRLQFVNEIVPEAKYIYIVRDGFDVVGSALRKSRQKIDYLYTLKKIRYIPVFSMHYYVMRFMKSLLGKIKKSKKAKWGPLYAELISKNIVLNEEYFACQWRECVDRADEYFSTIEDSRYLEVKYEELVHDPVHIMNKIVRFLDLYPTESFYDDCKGEVYKTSVGKGASYIGMDKCEVVNDILSETLHKHGYK